MDVLDACDERDEDELDRFALRGMKMAAPLGTPSAVHAWRLMFWKLTGGATAVIGVAVGGGVDVEDVVMMMMMMMVMLVLVLVMAAAAVVVVSCWV